MHTHHINADDLRLVLVTRRMRGLACKWAAMSPTVKGTHTECTPWKNDAAVRLVIRATAQPMDAGLLYRAVNRVAAHGAREVRKTWGIGIRALRKQQLFVVPHRQS